MNEPFPWSPEYETGNWMIDSQHRRLLELAGLLAEAAEKNRSEDVVADALAALESYTHFHFAEEEEYLAEIGSPLCEAHRRMHASLALDVEALRFQRVSRFAGVGKQVARWVERCLVPHMIRDDVEALAQGKKS